MDNQANLNEWLRQMLSLALDKRPLYVNEVQVQRGEQEIVLDLLARVPSGDSAPAVSVGRFILPLAMAEEVGRKMTAISQQGDIVQASFAEQPMAEARWLAIADLFGTWDEDVFDETLFAQQAATDAETLRNLYAGDL